MSTLLKEYVAEIRKRLLLLLLISCATALMAYIIASRQGITYEVNYSYLVSLQERPSSSQYQFDGYYALQAIELFTKTLSEWIMTPELIAQVYTSAHLPLPGLTSRHIQGSIIAQQSAPQLVHVVVKDKNPERAKRLAESLKTVVDEKVKDYQQQGAPAVRFIIVATDSWVGQTGLPTALIAIATGLFTFFVGVNGVLLWEGLKRL